MILGLIHNIAWLSSHSIDSLDKKRRMKPLFMLVRIDLGGTKGFCAVIVREGRLTCPQKYKAALRV